MAPAMAFLKDLRRRSKSGFRASFSFQNSSQSKTELSEDQSSSTLDSSYESQRTASSSIGQDLPSSLTPRAPPLDAGTLATPPQRPVPITAQSSRNSVVGSSSFLANGSPRPQIPTWPYAPRIDSISDNSWVHQKILLVYGKVPDSSRRHPAEGTIAVYYAQDNLPPTHWPVKDSSFKALVHLVPGPNKIRFDYLSPRASHMTIHPTWLSINYLPLQNVPPLQLAIIIAKDSECQFPTTPGQVLTDGTDLDIAARKLRMAAYLWQAFTGEQMYQNNFGRRCFRYDEEWQPGTLSARDIDSGQMRSEAKVHIIRCNETVAELSALKCNGQDRDTASGRCGVCGVLRETVRKHFNLQPGQKQYVSAVLLDSFWNTKSESFRGGGAARSILGGNLKISLVSAPCIAGYPSCIEDVVPALMDFKSQRIDSVTDSSDEQAADSETRVSQIMGAHLRLTYQLFGCPDPWKATIRGDSLRLDRALIAEGHSQQNENSVPQGDDASWSRRDVIRFRFHPSFRLPSDGQASDQRIHAWPVDNDKVIMVSPSGIAFVEIFVDDDDVCRGYLEYVNAEAGNCGIPKQVTLTEHGIRHSLSESSKKSKRLKVVVYSGGLRAHTIDDFSQAAKSKLSAVKLPNGHSGYRGSLIGTSKRPDSSPTDLILESAVVQTKLLVSIKVHFDMVMFVTGIEFCYEDSTSQLLGRKTGEHANGEFMLDTRRGEILMGFHLKFGAVVEGIEILTSLGRKSGVFGRAANGQG